MRWPNCVEPSKRRTLTFLQPSHRIPPDESRPLKASPKTSEMVLEGTGIKNKINKTKLKHLVTQTVSCIYVLCAFQFPTRPMLNMTAEEHAAIQCYCNSKLLFLAVCVKCQGTETAISVNKVEIVHAFQFKHPVN